MKKVVLDLLPASCIFKILQCDTTKFGLIIFETA